MVENCKCKSCGCGKMTMDEMWSMINDNTLPFTEQIIDENTVIRTFKPNYPEHLFKWHIDDEGRRVTVLNNSDWKFQYDNELPIDLSKDLHLIIGKDIYHRLIKGTTELQLKINKLL
jgi:hypothetical protein